jgi:hypothetical protein
MGTIGFLGVELKMPLEESELLFGGKRRVPSTKGE